MPVADISAAVRVRVPAKVNLHLGVGELRPDGFHDLTTVFQAVGIFDEVHARRGRGIALTVSGASAVPDGPDNIAWRAAQLLAEQTGTHPDVSLHIEKSIPVAGGMAGGSADAAAALLSCARLWDLDAGPVELTALAARLGSDVAFPLLGGTALGTGRGEILEPVDCAAPLHWVFALADFGISAGAAYRELDRLRAAGRAPAPAGPPDRLLAALADGDVEKVARALVNDLEPAAESLAPALRATLAAGRDRGALAGIVSGSGPTCAFLCPDADAAAQLAAELTADGITRASRVARGPAAGAKVVG